MAMEHVHGGCLHTTAQEVLRYHIAEYPNQVDYSGLLLKPSGHTTEKKLMGQKHGECLYTTAHAV